MKSTFTISAVVVVHLAVLALIGCRSTSFPENNPTRLDAFGGRVGTPEAQPLPEPAVIVDAPVINEPAITPHEPIKPHVVDAPAGETREYVVKKGDSLWSIEKREGIKFGTLAKLNNLPTNATLKEKQIIKLPIAGASNGTVANGTATADDGDIYVVKNGDVLGTIAQKTGTTVAKIRAANNLKTDKITVGQKLRIPAGATPPNTAGKGTTGGTTPVTPPPPVTPQVRPVTPADPYREPQVGEPGWKGFGGFGVSSPTATPAPGPVEAQPVPAPVEAMPVSAPTQVNY